LAEVREELIQQQYLADPDYRAPSKEHTDFYRYKTPSGWELLVGRNNRQNELLTFRTAGSYDLWFHTQEIPGSHVLLRLEAGASPATQDLQFAANLAAYYSRARQSNQVPVVYTQPNHIYKPKGAKPGMVIYKHEQILWGSPQMAATHIAKEDQVRPQDSNQKEPLSQNKVVSTIS
jgi:predicted ribosome quality control (RQC) complex YloA/Tae2 family protein